MRARPSRPETGRNKSRLHELLQDRYAEELGGAKEVKVGRYRIDVLAGNRALEIQVSGLHKIQEKVSRLLLMGYEVDVIVPVQKKLVTPRGAWEHRTEPRVLYEMVHFMRVFPSPNLRVRFLLLSEYRSWSRYKAAPRKHFRRDTTPVDILGEIVFAGPQDVIEYVRPPRSPFTASDLSRTSGLSRTAAQRACYVLLRSGAAKVVGRSGRARLYLVA